MSGKNQVPLQLNWQSVNPVTGFLPLNNNTAGKGSVPSGVLVGVMSGTSTIYSQIFDVSRMDNDGLEISWSGNPVGTISYLASISGSFFFPISLTTAQPAGSASGFGVNLNQYPYKYLLIQYTNSSGAGSLSAWIQEKDLN
jgi:hypothetical protein